MDNGGPAAMSLSRLLEERRARLARGESAIEETIELHRKLVLPAAALLLPFVGVPLGAVGRRGVKSRGLLLSTIVVLVYYLALTGAVTVAREQILPTAVAMWLPDVLLADARASCCSGARPPRSRSSAAAVRLRRRPRMNLLARHLVGLYLRTFALCLAGGDRPAARRRVLRPHRRLRRVQLEPALVAAYFALKTPEMARRGLPGRVPAGRAARRRLAGAQQRGARDARAAASASRASAGRCSRPASC